MSKYTQAMSTMHDLSITAMEEASRYGLREADIDHLFIALLVSEQSAGQSLRQMGITLNTAREVIQAMHAENLASLGISSQHPKPGPIALHEIRGYEWSERADSILTKASSGRKSGDAAAVLRELVNEPSGLIEDLLHRLGTSPAAVLTQLNQNERTNKSEAAYSQAAGHLTRTAKVFIPAPQDDVWALVSSPDRIPEWELSTASVNTSDTVEARTGDTWTAAARTHRPDGKPTKVKAEHQRVQVELSELEAPNKVAWRFTLPDDPRTNTRNIRIELTPVTGGTRANITFSWQRPDAKPSRKLRLLSVAIWPFYRYFLWVSTNQVTEGISRVFRNTTE